MKAMSKFWMALVVGVAVMAVSTQLWAVPLSNTDISWATFTYLVDISNPVGIPFEDHFVFRNLDGYITVSGDIQSGVFPGKSGTPAENLYAYIYQFHVDVGGVISSFSLELKGPGPTMITVGGTDITSFYIGSGVPDYFFYGQGNKAPASYPYGSQFTFPPPAVKFSWAGNEVGAGEASFIVGFFSPVLPTTTVVNLVDTGVETENPFVYTPSPEPSISLLLGAGLLGGIIWSRGKKKIMKKA